MFKWTDVKQFCEKDGWKLYKQTNRWYYRKIMPDGTLKRVKIYMEDAEISALMWKEILARQLQVSQADFDAIINRPPGK
ncbi:MAG TPA: hypothetical protein DD811_12935 [Syntrophomonas sp.]|jgi:hypothetical protein|nr:hypothetical protein [Syntrophomonas sp.]